MFLNYRVKKIAKTKFIHMKRNTMKTERLSSLALMHSHPGAYEGGGAPLPPSMLALPERGHP